MSKLNLMTHCGSNHVTRDQLAGEATPKGTATHRPIPHTMLWDKCLAAFQRSGYNLVGEAHAVNKWGRIEDHEPECHNQYFGLMELNRDSVLGHDGEALLEGEASLVAGIRNAHAKRLSAITSPSTVSLPSAGDIRRTSSKTSMAAFKMRFRCSERVEGRSRIATRRTNVTN